MKPADSAQALVNRLASLVKRGPPSLCRIMFSSAKQLPGPEFPLRAGYMALCPLVKPSAWSMREFTRCAGNSVLRDKRVGNIFSTRTSPCIRHRARECFHLPTEFVGGLPSRGGLRALKGLSARRRGVVHNVAGGAPIRTRGLRSAGRAIRTEPKEVADEAEWALACVPRSQSRSLCTDPSASGFTLILVGCSENPFLYVTRETPVFFSFCLAAILISS